MPGMRNKRLERLFQQLISRYLALHSPLKSPGLVVVTHVKMTPRLGSAKVFLSLVGQGRPQAEEKMLEAVLEVKSAIRHYVGEQLAGQLYRMPALSFLLDRTAQEAGQMEQLLDEL